MIPPLRELQRWTRQRLGEIRDVAGLNMAALTMISKIVNDKKEMQQEFGGEGDQGVDIWAGLGLGSDVAAALEGRRVARRT